MATAQPGPGIALTDTGANAGAATRPTVVGIVDDDHAVRDSLKFLLEIDEYVVATFASAAELLRYGVQQLACLILDQHMPHMTGLELVQRLRADGVALPIMLVTGSPSPDLTRRAAALGIEDVLEKPIHLEKLMEFICTAVS